MAIRLFLAVLLVVSAIFAYTGIPHMSESPFISSEQPRRLASAFLQSLSFEASTSKTTKDAARRTVAHLRLRGLRHRLARLHEGEDGILDDDKDSARIQGYLSRAKAYAQRQQFELAMKLFTEGADKAADMLHDLSQDKAGPVGIDDAEDQLTDAVMQNAAFYLERGETGRASSILKKASQVIHGRTDATAIRCRLLAANAQRDAGNLVDAVALYEALFETIRFEADEIAADPNSSPLEKAMLDEIAAEAEGEYAREMLSEGKIPEALKLLEETLDKLVPSLVSVHQGRPTLLAARLRGWLAFAHLKNGNANAAIDLLDVSLAGIGELPTGLAGATSEVQELLQTRAMAKAAIGSVHGATEDLEVVSGLQDELKKTISDDHNPKYADGKSKVPDPRLWVSMARTRAIAADLKLQTASAKEALPLAKQAHELLDEVKKSDGKLPKGYNLATFAEVTELLAKLRSETMAVVLDESGRTTGNWIVSDESGHDTAASEEDVPVPDIPEVVQEPTQPQAEQPESGRKATQETATTEKLLEMTTEQETDKKVQVSEEATKKQPLAEETSD